MVDATDPRGLVPRSNASQVMSGCGMTFAQRAQADPAVRLGLGRRRDRLRLPAGPTRSGSTRLITMSRISTDIGGCGGTFSPRRSRWSAPPLAVRLLPGLAATLVLPGYAMSVALLPDRDFNTAERLAVSFGLSLALIVVVSILISWTPWGFRSGAPHTGPCGHNRWSVRDHRMATAKNACSTEWSRVTSRSARRASTIIGIFRPVPARHFGIPTRVGRLGCRVGSVSSLAHDRVLRTRRRAAWPRTIHTASLSAGPQEALAVGIVNGEGRPTRFRVSVMLDGQTVGCRPALSLSTIAGCGEGTSILLLSRRRVRPRTRSGAFQGRLRRTVSLASALGRCGPRSVTNIAQHYSLASSFLPRSWRSHGGH